MSRFSHTLLALALATACAGLLAQTAAQTTQNRPSSRAAAMQAGTDQMAAMDSQMKAMREMHEKMANAKTPEERNALMADNMKTMQDGMAMMNMMGGAGMGGMNQRQQTMEKRMEMMQSMMQMMIDRMPSAPAKQ